MTMWRDVQEAAPEFAHRVRALFDAHRHKTIATLRADGSPRISGIEMVFDDGVLVFGSMPNAERWGSAPGSTVRIAQCHGRPGRGLRGGMAGRSEDLWAGHRFRLDRYGPDGDLFHADITEVVHTRLNKEATMLVVEWWTPVHGLQKIERE